MKKIALILILLPFLTVMLFTSAAVIYEYKPEAVEPAELINAGSVEKNVKNSKSVTILTWNTGYAGLGKNADFFMDGGVSSRPSDSGKIKENLNGIVAILQQVEPDIILLQEVDRSSRRAFKIDQARVLKSAFVNFESFYAVNFRVLWVPKPFADPIGNVESGVMTISRSGSKAPVERVSLPNSSFWIDRVFNLKRCMLVTRYKIEKTKRELVVINLHLSAYENEQIKTNQLNFVKKYITDQYSKGNSVVAGGDWNHILPGIEKGTFGKYTTDESFLGWAAEMPERWTPEGWKWVIDQRIPTVRNNEKPYVQGENFTTIIDGFLVSPDLDVESVFTFSTGFEYSDHQPVVMTIKL